MDEEKLSAVTAGSVLRATPRLCTDIWCEDVTANTVTVMRRGRQWHLNETASLIWLRIHEGRTVRAIVDELCDASGDDDRTGIERATIAFLFSARTDGLLHLEWCAPEADESGEEG